MINDQRHLDIPRGKKCLKPHDSKRNDGICFRIRMDSYVYILYLTAPPSILTLTRAHRQSFRSRLIQAKAYLKMNDAFLQHDKEETPTAA